MIAVELLLKILLPYRQLTKGFIHILHLLLALQTFTVFASDITSNSIQNSLEAIFTGDLPLLFQFKKIRDCECFDRSEFEPKKCQKQVMIQRRLFSLTI